MQLIPSTGQALFTTFNALYQGAYGGVPKFFQDFCTTMPSSSTQQLYHWIAQIPGMKEWIGERQLNNAVLRNYQLTNKNFEDSIRLDKFLVEDDQYGSFGPTVQAFGDSVGRWEDEQMAAIVEGATANLCYDGQPFFSTSHPVSISDPYAVGLDGSATFSNKLVGAQYDIGASGNAVAAWTLGRAKMATYVGDAGKVLALQADTLMVPPALEAAAKIIGQAEITAQTIKNVAGSENVAAAGVTNIWRGTLSKIIVNPYLTTSAAYVMCSLRPIKPFVWQLRKAPVFTALVDPTLPNMWKEREFLYGAESRGAGGYSLPQLCVRLSAS